MNKEYSGLVRVQGGVGTGKIVVAMHRAKHLATRLSGSQRILFTTFTANLAVDINENQLLHSPAMDIVNENKILFWKEDNEQTQDGGWTSAPNE